MRFLRGRPSPWFTVMLAMALTAFLAPLASADCDFVASPIVNVTNPNPNKQYCAGDKLRFEFCTTNIGTSAPPTARVQWHNLLLPNCFSSYTWVKSPSTDHTCGTATDACVRNFTIQPSQTECIQFEATLVNPISPNPKQCGIDSYINFGNLNDPCGEAILFFDAGCSPPGTPDLRLYKTMENHTVDAICSAGDVTEGSTINWLIEAVNVGSGSDTSVVITDPLPAGLINFKLVEPACTLCDVSCAACLDAASGKLTVNVGTLAKGATFNVRFSTDVTVTCKPGPNRSISNQASVTSTGAPGGRVSDNKDNDGTAPERTCTGPIPPTGTPTLAVTKTADRTTVGPNQKVHYTITLDATASACPSAGYIDDQSPAFLNVDPTSLVVNPAFTPKDIQGKGKGTDGAGYVKVWGITVAPGTTEKIEYDAIADPTAVCNPPAVNAVSYIFDSGSGTASAPPVAFTGALPDKVQVDKTVDNPKPKKDDIVTYTIVVTSLGSCPIAGGVLDDPIPAGLTFNPGDVTIPPATSNASTAAMVRVTGLSLGPAGSPTDKLTVTFKATVDGSKTGIIDNVATATFPTASAKGTVPIDVQSPPPVCTTPPPPVQMVLGVKQAGNVRIQWGSVPTTNASTFNVYKVANGDKTLIPLAKTPATPPVLLLPCSPVVLIDSFCVDSAAVPGPPNLYFYQVRGVCGGTLEGG